VQLVGDEQNGAVVGGQVADDVEQAIALLRRQDGGRLVEDQNTSVAIERLQDLDALAHADRELTDDGVGIDPQAVAVCQGCDALRRLAAVDEAEAGRLHAVDDVFPDRQRIEQLERLVDHAHAGADGVQRRAVVHLGTAQNDAAGIGRLHAVENRHQRRFAGAVFAHHGVNLSAQDGEVDVVIGDERPVALDDAGSFELDRRHISEKPPAYFASCIGSATFTVPATTSSRSAFTLAITSGNLAIRQPESSMPGSRLVSVMPPSARP
jgi:hypothetical protein